jgi:hypothetical protein
VPDLPRREVVVHTDPGEAGCRTVRRLPWTTPLSVLGVPVDLATLLADVRAGRRPASGVGQHPQDVLRRPSVPRVAAGERAAAV